MADAFAEVAAWLQSAVSYIISGYEGQLLTVAMYTVAIAVYAVLVWKFYRFIAKKDIFVLKGRDSKLPTWLSFLAYLVVFPLVTFIAFLFFAFLLVFLAKEQTVPQILIVSVTLIAAIRVASYYKEDLAMDLAKMIPLALLGVFLVDPSYYSFGIVLDRLFSLPSMAALIARYLLFVVLLEWVLRLLLRAKHYALPPGKE